jgi:hypothetical protein
MPEQPQTDFGAFWDKWPDKRAKEVARKAWGKLTAAEQAIASDRAKAWFNEWRKRNPHASPIMASTYLNQRRFYDMDEKPKADVNASHKAVASQVRSGNPAIIRTLKPSQIWRAVEAGVLSDHEARTAERLL